jgi:UrcA family protein
MKRAILCAALGASVFVGAAAAAWAEDGQMRVALGDLNMTTREGAKEALARIAFSVDPFCEADGGHETLERAAVVSHCVTDMTRKSVAQLDMPMVTALLNDRLPQRPATATVALAQK